MMTEDVLPCGVGSQGTVLTSRLIALAAMEKGMEVRGVETIGMAQRGGGVMSHVRTGEEIYPPLVSHGGANVITGFEPAEAVRCLPHLKKSGCVAIPPVPIQSMTASLTGGTYTGREMVECLEYTGENLVVVDAVSVGVECDSSKMMNVALLGAVIVSRLIGIFLEEVEAAIEKRMPEKLKDINMEALKLGAAASAMIR